MKLNIKIHFLFIKDQFFPQVSSLSSLTSLFSFFHAFICSWWFGSGFVWFNGWDHDGDVGLIWWVSVAWFGGSCWRRVWRWGRVSIALESEDSLRQQGSGWWGLRFHSIIKCDFQIWGLSFLVLIFGFLVFCREYFW